MIVGVVFGIVAWFGHTVVWTGLLGDQHGRPNLYQVPKVVHFFIGNRHAALRPVVPGTGTFSMDFNHAAERRIHRRGFEHSFGACDGVIFLLGDQPLLEPTLGVLPRGIVQNEGLVILAAIVLFRHKKRPFRRAPVVPIAQASAPLLIRKAVVAQVGRS